MSLTADKIIADAKKVAGRLKDRITLGDTILMEAGYINEQLESLRSVQDEFESLNLLGRNHTNNQMVHAINQEHPHLRDIQIQNRELRACLQDYQRALEHIMTKYREHTQKKILNSQVSFTYLSQNDARFNNKYIDKILEMVAVMRAAAEADEQNYERAGREQDVLINKLMTENKGLREMLQISRDFGNIASPPTTAETGSQTDDLLAATFSMRAAAQAANDNTMNSSGMSSVVAAVMGMSSSLADGSTTADDEDEDAVEEDDEDVLTNNSCTKPNSLNNSTSCSIGTLTSANATIVQSTATAADANHHIINNNNTINIKCNQSTGSQQLMMADAALPPAEETTALGGSVATVVAIDQGS